MSRPAIRPAGKADLAAIAALHLESESAAAEGTPRAAAYAAQDPALKLAAWERFLARPGHRVLMSEAGSLRGLVAFVLPQGGAHEAEIKTLYVSPAYWRNGIGQALCQAAIEELQAADCKLIRLWVYADNQRARSFYTRLGFRRSGAEQQIHHPGQDALALEYLLDLKHSA